MPLYTTVQDVLGRVPSLGSMSRISSAYIASAIATEQAYLDAALGTRYAVPFENPPPPLVREITADLALARVLASRDLMPESGGEQIATGGLQRAQAVLERLAGGTLVLVTGSGTPLFVAPAGASVPEAWSDSLERRTIFNGQPFSHISPDHPEDPRYTWDHRYEDRG